jgi:hypothetical protein
MAGYIKGVGSFLPPIRKAWYGKVKKNYDIIKPIQQRILDSAKGTEDYETVQDVVSVIGSVINRFLNAKDDKERKIEYKDFDPEPTLALLSALPYTPVPNPPARAPAPARYRPMTTEEARREAYG